MVGASHFITLALTSSKTKNVSLKTPEVCNKLRAMVAWV